LKHEYESGYGLSDRIIVLNYGRRSLRGHLRRIQKNEEVIKCLSGRRRKIAPEAKNLTVRYGAVKALESVLLTWTKEKIVAMIGSERRWEVNCSKSC